ncbi:GNAT family N-acetyltransferase [Halobacillus litoralis]|uniref:N-acetyltransferase n=1 Tax=Halobacillus litoralis TaxID=45668 RepID=A0A410M9T4_9BACI|nr:GNAT family N-acetyltransferase [Halobacillus litoralis]QAS51491.1 N-acetyltransferase [Halobacillus litoralis]
MIEGKINIVPLTIENIEDVNATNDYFTVFGRLIPTFNGRIWTHEEELFNETKEIKFPDDHLNWEEFLDNGDKTLFFAYMKGKCVGQIRMMKARNRFCYIENIAVIKQARKQGVGTELLKVAEKWARERNLAGLSLETQNDNLGAIRFYIRHGFELGGVDTHTHMKNPNIDIALYWYKPL